MRLRELLCRHYLFTEIHAHSRLLDVFFLCEGHLRLASRNPIPAPTKLIAAVHIASAYMAYRLLDEMRVRRFFFVHSSTTCLFRFEKSDLMNHPRQNPMIQRIMRINEQMPGCETTSSIYRLLDPPKERRVLTISSSEQSNALAIAHALSRPGVWAPVSYLAIEFTGTFEALDRSC